MRNDRFLRQLMPSYVGSIRLIALIVTTLAFIPNLAWACACGCGVFDVGTSSLICNGKGATAFFEYDFMNQNHNWSGDSKAPNDNNDDKQIRSHFYTAGLQYMFSRQWGIMIDVPYTHRYFKTTDDDTGDIVGFNHSSFGDIRIQALYSGFSGDMSTGVSLGVKVPTGGFKDPNFDRDTAIGSGSTDLLLGVYHVGKITKDNSWVWFGQAQWDKPLAIQGGYRPGAEVDGAIGVYFNDLYFGKDTKLAPILQLIGSNRTKDGGPAADPPNTGYNRLMISPGLELDYKDIKFYGDVEFPIYQYMNGNQLVAPALFKFIVSYSL